MSLIASRRLTSTVTTDGFVEISLLEETIGDLRPHEVVVRVDAAPVNPSDIAVLLAGAPVERGVAGAGVRLPLDASALARATLRAGTPLWVGNEGAGVVVAAGDSPQAAGLLGQTVAVLGGGTFAEHVRVPWTACMPFDATTSPRSVASVFVNPLTVLAMIETMRDEGHSAIVHTAAASNLGQMLVRVGRADDVAIVNVVRRPEHVTLLRGLGAEHVCDSSSEGFHDELADAIAATGATLAFDAVGGEMPGRLLVAMERALLRTGTVYSPYGTTTHKQVYAYGILDPAPISVPREVGMAWGVGGWLLGPYLQRVGVSGLLLLRDRVAAGLHDLFASGYSAEVRLDDLLDLDVLRAIDRRSTGEKFLVVNP